MKNICYIITICLFFSQCVINCSNKNIQNKEQKKLEVLKNEENFDFTVLADKETAEPTKYTYGQYQDESVKILKYSGKLQLPDSYGRTLMRTDNNDIVFISSINYLEIKNMSMKSIEIPTKFPDNVIKTLPEYLREEIKDQESWIPPPTSQFFCARPPYSNNKVHINITGTSAFFLYDITNKFLDVRSYKNEYAFAHPDASVNYNICSPEYWLGSAELGRIWLMQKDGTFYENPLEYIISDFSGTIFDNGYIMETIRTINETKEDIITKDDIYFSNKMGNDYMGNNKISDVYRTYGSYSDANGINYKYNGKNTFFYFINRMGVYFNINIQDIFQFSDINYDKRLSREAGIYKDGFFIQDGRKVLLLDVKNHKTTLYTFDEYIDYCNNENYKSLDCRLFITNDSKTLLLKIEYRENRGYHDYAVIYKYELY